MSMIRVRDFVTKSAMEEPKTATYKNIKVMSKGEGGNRHVYFMVHGNEVLYFWVDTHCDGACFVHSVKGDFEYKALLHQFMHEYEDRNSWFYTFETWEDFEKCFLYLLEEFKFYKF